MFYCICLTTRNGRGRLRGTLRLNARQFEADERGRIGRGQISSNPCKMGVASLGALLPPRRGHRHSLVAPPSPRLSSTTGIRRHYTLHLDPAPPPKKHQRRYLSIPPPDSPFCLSTALGLFGSAGQRQRETIARIDYRS